MKKIHIEFSDERLITPSGLVFVGQILGKSSFVKKINRAPISKDYLPKHSASVLTQSWIPCAKTSSRQMSTCCVKCT